MKTNLILEKAKLRVELDGKHGRVVSDWYSKCPGCGEPMCDHDCRGRETDDAVLNRLSMNFCISAIEQVVLRHALSGIDVTTPKYQHGIIQSILNIRQAFL